MATPSQVGRTVQALTALREEKKHPLNDVETRTNELGAKSISKSTLTFYFAGGLFDTHQLAGNALLAEAIERVSEGRYKALLPQNIEFRDFSPQGIRDQDLETVLEADLAVFQFNGTELDSGTVAEYMFAKFAGIRSVLLRTDFRSSGDQKEQGDPWNLMLSNFPGTEVLVIDSMAVYKKQLAEVGGQSTEASAAASVRMIEEVASRVIATMNKLMQTPSVMPKGLQKAVYQWLAIFPGFKKGDEVMTDFSSHTLAHKQEFGLL